MTTTDLAGFEARAAEAERRLAALEAQVLGGGAAAAGGAAAGGLAGEDLAATLEGLYKVRILMGKAAHEKAALERENAALKAANARLETDTGRMKYQILHLKRNLVAAQGGEA